MSRVISTEELIQLRRFIAELQQSDAFLRSVLESVPAFIGVVTTDGRHCFLNRLAPGIDLRDTAELVGSTVYDFVLPEFHEVIRACLERVARTGEPGAYECAGLGPYDRLSWYETRVGPIKRRGEVIALVLVATDVTERKEMELRIRESEQRYRSVVAVLEEGIVVQGADGVIQACNVSAERILGLTAAQMVGRDSLDPRWRAIHEDGSPFPGQDHPAIVTLRTGRPQSNVIMGVHRPDGTLAWISINSLPLRRTDDVVPHAVVVSFVDITERKRSKRALERLLAQEQAGRRRAAFLAEASEALAASLDTMTTLEAVVRLAVPRLADLTAAELLDEQGELGSSHPLVVASIDPELQALYCEARRRYPVKESNPLTEALRSERPRLIIAEELGTLLEAAAYDAEHLAIKRRLFGCSAIVVPLSARGQRLGVLLLTTIARELSPEDLDLAAELGRLAALAIDNARLYRQAQEAARIRDEFLAIASHELRTPLTPVMLNLHQLLRMSRAPDDCVLPETVLSKLRSTTRQVERLHRLIEELLDISRITGERLHLEPEDTDLAALTADVVERLAEEIRRAGCKVELKAPHGVRGQWDRLRLEQVVTNLLTNAVKYGSGRPIEILLEADGSTARMSVRDHGIGIAPQDQERIFQRFERAVSERHYGGFGLGLWITRQILVAMGGSIRVSSRVGEGSTFTIELPRGRV